MYRNLRIDKTKPPDVVYLFWTGYRVALSRTDIVAVDTNCFVCGETFFSSN